MSFLNIIIPLFFLIGGILVIIYHVYPYMEMHTSNPVLYTSLLVGGVVLLQYIFSRGQSLAGIFFTGDLLRILIGK